MRTPPGIDPALSAGGGGALLALVGGVLTEYLSCVGLSHGYHPSLWSGEFLNAR